MATVKPLQDRVLVRVVGRQRELASGIVLPDNIRQESDRGEVVAVGPGRLLDPSEEGARYEPLEIEVGDVVLFSPYAGSEVSAGDEKLMLLKANDLLGILTD